MADAANLTNDYENGVQAARRVRESCMVPKDDHTLLPHKVVNYREYLRGVYEHSGVFDGCAICMFKVPHLLSELDRLGIAYTCKLDMVDLKHVNALDFLGHIYQGSQKYGLTVKHQQFIDHIGGLVKCRVWKTDPDAVVPYKVRPSDVGYDLVAIRKVKQLTPATALYDTGIKVSVELGHYAEIVPRSSISKSGYMLANSTGIIDPGYTDNLYIALCKVDPSMPDLTLPFRGCQLIIRKQIHAEIEVMDDTNTLTLTGRAAGGFGSTG